MDIATVAQSPTPDAPVSLFRFDTTSLGGSVYFFTPARFDSASVFYATQEYTPIDIEFSGFETAAGGTLPQPTMRIANSDPTGWIQSLLNSWGDLVGCEIRRIRVFSRFLDGQPYADPTAYIGPDVFRIEQKTDDNPVYVEWSLSASFDQEGKMIPGRVIVRDTCAKRYRRYDPTNADAALDGYVYPQVGDLCPYDGGSAFDAENRSTTAANDRCSRHLSGCKLRFGAASPLPFGGFPGAARVRL